MQVINIIGCQCSGKTTLIRELMDKITYPSAHYDILEFYKNNDVIGSDKRMDWDKWEKAIHKLPASLNAFFKVNSLSSSESVAFVESAGTNQMLNSYIKEHYPKAVTFCLEIPTNPVLLDRAKAKDLPEDIIKDSTRYFRKNTYRLPDRYSYDQICKMVPGYLESLND